MNRAFAFYISHFPTYKLVYGAFASIPIFLLWIYLSWLTLLFGAIIAASIPHWRSRHALKIDQAARLYFALHMLKAINEGSQTGDIPDLPTLSRRLRIGYEEIEHILKKLGDAKIVAKLSGPGWVMARAPENVSMAELLHLFLLDTAVLPKQPAEERIVSWFAALENRMNQPSGQTLRDIWEKEA